jgi:uncharacterized membrane protein YhaH (DUF805 family)
MQYMFAPLKKYADFQGRARRAEYWQFYLLYLIVYVVLLMLSMSTRGSPLAMVVAALLGVFVLGLVIPMLAVGVRRLHDTNRSGWWLLISLIPLLGAIVLLVFMVLEGSRGPN